MRRLEMQLLAALLLVVTLHLRPNNALQTRPPRFDRGNDALSTLTRVFKPLTNVVQNTYSFFYWLPRRNTPFDVPWVLFRNTSSEFLAYYQWPHNLPPYIYLSEGYPEDFFCWGLPGNTLPLGNWDPWFMQNTSPQVMRKYRESELKHGRLAMLGCAGFLIQEVR